MELRSYLEIIRRRWWLLVSVPLLSALVAYWVSQSLTPIYQATATMLVNQTQTPGVVLYNDILTSERLTNTFAQLVKRQPVLAETNRTLGLPITEEQLKDKIDVATIRNTQLLSVSVQDSDPVAAAQIANTIANVFIQQNSNQLSQPGTVFVAEQALVPSAPIKPNVLLNTMLAGMLGFMIAGSVSLLFEYLDDTVKSAADVDSLLGLPMLASVSRFRAGRKKSGRALIPEDARSEPAETYRQLRTSIQFAKVGADLRTIVVTSATPGEGKSTTIANLSIVLAQAGNRVILVDTDLRRPVLHNLFNVSNSFGLTGLLLSESSQVSPAVLKTTVKNLAIIPSGPQAPNPSELLSSRLMEAIAKSAADFADYVLFDSPPVLAVTDASILASLTDGSILVVESGKTRSDVVSRAYQTLSLAGKRTLRVVLNKTVSRRGAYYNYPYRHKADSPSQTKGKAGLAATREATRDTAA